MSSKKFTFLCLFILSAIITHGQDADSTDIESPESDDSVIALKAPHLKKHFWRASGELLLTELIPWSYNYFVRDAEFAHISFESIGHNLKPSSWEWDDNNFKTNQFAHPYHGNLYYNSFRSNGYSFWQSVPAAFAGSFIWEVAGETHNPAPNDFINTSIGGIALGEMTYRIAGLIINEKKHGAGRQVQEAFALLVNPVNSFNRVVDGRWGKVAFTDPEDSLYCDVAADFGLRRVAHSSGELFSKGQNEWFASLGLRYGNPFKDFKKPFDNFYVYIEVGNADSAKLNTLIVQGSLWGKIIGGGEKSLHMLRLTMNYDYIHNSTFEYGGQSLLMAWTAHYEPAHKLNIYTEIGGGAVILAAVPDEYLYYGEGRNYDYGPGLSYAIGGQLNYADRIFCSARYRGGWTTTLNGNNSDYWLQGYTTDIRFMIFKGLSVAATYGNYRLHGHYEDYPNTNDKFPYLKLAAGYKIVF
jgi:hypothetical protein